MKNMFSIKGIVLIILMFVLMSLVVYAVDPGTDGDPLISLSYLEEALDELKSGFESKITALEKKINALEKEDSSKEDDVTSENTKSSGFRIVNLKKGETLSLGESAEIILRTGSATVVGGKAGGLSDVTSGKDVPDGAKVELNHLLITPRNDGRGIKVSENSAVMVKE